MMNDRELLDLSAKAAGIVGEYYCGVLNDEWVDGIIYIRSDGQQCVWNPLADDGDALRLAVKIELSVNIERTTIDVYDRDFKLSRVWAEEVSDPYAATRRAIVRAAAEIGKEMK